MRTLPGTEYYRRLAEMPLELRARLDDLAYRHGRTYDSYLVTEPDREYFWSSDRRGVVGFHRWLKYLHVVGGLIAADEDRASLLTEFNAFCRANRKHATFYNIGDDEAPLFRRQGFQLTKAGEEPILDLPYTTWRGKPFEWLRRQENWCRRKGVVCREVIACSDDDEYRCRVAPELQVVSREHIESTPFRRELQFFEGRFDPLDLRRRRLFIAEGGSGAGNGAPPRIEAFVVCNPAEAGRMWAIEIYRHRSDALRGVVPYLMLHVARTLKAEGVERLSLSLCPGLRCETPLEGDSAMVRIGTGVWWRWGSWMFDLRGIYHYKSRFRPEFHNRYFAAMPKLTVLSIRSFLLLWGIVVPSPQGMLNQVWRKWRQRPARAHLASPASACQREWEIFNGKAPDAAKLLERDPSVEDRAIEASNEKRATVESV
jgi:phosphatidylglycerol lysyltransferase